MMKMYTKELRVKNNQNPLEAEYVRLLANSVIQIKQCVFEQKQTDQGKCVYLLPMTYLVL